MRTLRTALDLFAEHGVGATSYQMIADAIGVTKGAIYHQFKTKDEIIIAVAEMELAKLEDALEAAEAEDNPERGRELLLNRIIEHVVEHRRGANTFQFDPIIVRLLSDHEPFQRFVERLYGMLVGDGSGPGTLVRLAALTCVVGGTVAHPLVAGLDDETLRDAAGRHGAPPHRTPAGTGSSARPLQRFADGNGLGSGRAQAKSTSARRIHP